MSDREELINVIWGQGDVPEETAIEIADAVIGWQAARESEGGEAVPESYVARLERLLEGIENIRRNAGGDGYLWGYSNAMHKDLSELLAAPQPDKWIPIDEKLPDVSGVRLKLKDGSQLSNCLTQSDYDFYWKGGGSEMFILEHEVVAWMPEQESE